MNIVYKNYEMNTVYTYIWILNGLVADWRRMNNNAFMKTINSYFIMRVNAIYSRLVASHCALARRG